MPKLGAKDAWGGVTAAEVAVRGTSELMGTMLLVLLGCMGCLGGWDSGAPPVIQYSLTFGMVVMFVIQISGHISGAHVNPSVTLCALICREISLPLAAVYFVAQTAGALAGYGLLLVVTPAAAFANSTAFCVTMPHPSVSAGQAVIVEAVITCVLVLLTCSIWDHRNSHNTDGICIKFGFTITALAMAAGSYTGASMNPVRSLAPAFWTNQWKSHWVYWVGPLLGSAIASLFYCNIFKRGPQPTQHEEVPLNDIHDKSGNVSA